MKTTQSLTSVFIFFFSVLRRLNDDVVLVKVVEKTRETKVDLIKTHDHREVTLSLLNMSECNRHF